MAADVNKNLIEVKLTNDQAFLQIKETLTRIGIASRKDNALYQTAHILHKRGRYFIVHFKQLFEMDHRETDITSFDMERTYAIADLLQQWHLVTIVNPREYDNTILSTLKVIPFSEKKKWKLVPKYKIGIKHFN